MTKALAAVFISFIGILFYFQSALPEPVTVVSEESPAARILHEAKQMLVQVRISHYSHETRINEKSGVYILDCSALACYLLGRAAPWSLTSVTIDSLHRHARAVNFYATFANAPLATGRNGWRKIVRLMDTEPGDFIAWRKDPMPPNGDTGHIVIVLENPIKEKDGSIRVVVLDSSKSGHAQDTRKKGMSGIGFGSMWFRVNGVGAPIALHWSNRKGQPVELLIAVGRPTELAR